ncbi:LOW QUALITY PROTEIN: uncharacterized protein LOC127537536 [Acanthochromis polyacanthus]|uniref:LOW QUALITY PROTEIN: uncharacterized protein LOC127537536 n=1 Tax=Acanthochromis polyacanthus TaxID=80966 RepID=UPI002234AA7F|nr:LOW QUALITY PROTEIN: uncharacterized protein LOC127537536 [Acanthochromis polyacanthus]
MAADGESAVKFPTSEDRYDCIHERDFTADHLLQSDMKLNRELPLDYSSAYPQSNTDGFIEDDYRLYQAAEQEDDDACSSLCVNDDEIIDTANEYRADVADYHSHQLIYHDHESDLQYQGSQSHFYESNFHQPQVTSIQDSVDFKDLAAQRKSSLSTVRPGETSWRLHNQRTRSPGTQSESNHRRGPLIQGERRQEVDCDLDCSGACEAADSSIFDYCQTSEIESDTETVRKSTDEGNGESARWTAEVKEVQQDEFGEKGFVTPIELF